MPPTHPSQADVAAAYRTLIAHETEPKEQDFYRTRLQRLEQATEPECEFDCRSRVAAAGVGIYCPQCSAKSADTDLTTQLAKAIRAAWVDRLDWDELAQGALEFLTSAGRLIPSGGMALTAEEGYLAGKVMAALCTRNGYFGDPLGLVDALKFLESALFPATEPAEDLRVHNHTPYRGPGPDGHCAEHAENGRLRGQCMADTAPTVGRCPKELEGDIESFPCVLSAGHRERCKSAGGLTWGYFTPDDPAEEETKAERRDPDELAKRMALIWEGGWDEFDEKERDYLRCAAEIARAYYASSPVVPAPTETGPWQRIEDVPETVGRLTDRDGDIWEWDGDNWVTPETAILPTAYINRKYAPFVAAEEG